MEKFLESVNRIAVAVFVVLIAAWFVVYCWVYVSLMATW